MWLVRLTQRQVGGLAAEQGMLRFFCPREGAANAGWDVERGCQRSRNYMAKD